MDWYPLRFRPIYKDRIWGGNSLSTLYGRSLPGTGPIGESWEISDRPHDVSIVADGPLAGRNLHELLHLDPAGLLGDAAPREGRFPLLVKILDARQNLSLQVHPPPERAARLGGQAKSEVWYITDARPGAEVLAGLRTGVTRSDFESRLNQGTVADCFHRIPVRPGDALFLPSGRVHALGAGLVLFEIQENSDTTYRVYDWGRLGLDGKPRELHVQQSLESIDFQDFRPRLVDSPWVPATQGAWRLLVDHPLFRVTESRLPSGQRTRLALPRCAVLGVAQGTLVLPGAPSTTPLRLRPGDFVLLPAALGHVVIDCPVDATWIVAEPGSGPPPPPRAPDSPSKTNAG